jgi:hypothetical protein
MSAFLLPASRLAVELRPPGGRESLLLAEAYVLDLPLAIALLSRLAVPLAGAGTVDFGQLPCCDVDAAILELRRRLFGPRVVATMGCHECKRPFDIVFDLGEYLAHHAVAMPAGVAPDEQPGWFRLDDGALRFRLPTGDDLVAAAGAERALEERCTGDRPLGDDERARVEAALEAMAPDLCSDLEGPCPECGASGSARFDPTLFVLHELRARSARIFDEVHLLARAYHWSEDVILALPDDRRARYVERVLNERAMGWS